MPTLESKIKKKFSLWISYWFSPSFSSFLGRPLFLIETYFADFSLPSLVVVVLLLSAFDVPFDTCLFFFEDVSFGFFLLFGNFFECSIPSVFSFFFFDDDAVALLFDASFDFCVLLFLADSFAACSPVAERDFFFTDSLDFDNFFSFAFRWRSLFVDQLFAFATIAFSCTVCLHQILSCNLQTYITEKTTTTKTTNLIETVGIVCK